MTALACCRPTAYAGGGASVVVHGPLCDRAEERLTPEELALWRQVDPELEASVEAHPSSGRTPSLAEQVEEWNHSAPGHSCITCSYVDGNLDRDD